MQQNCNTCQVLFPSFELKKIHLKTEWHRYNLNRKASELAPITSDDFDLKQQSQVIVESHSDYSCESCSKTFKTENHYKNHLASRKHLNSMEAPVKVGPVRIDPAEKPLEKNWKNLLVNAETEEEIIQILEEKEKAALKLCELDCLFCSEKSQSLDDNLNHMALKHSFYIPLINKVHNVKDLLQYLGDKITIANVCIYCNGSGKMLHSLESVRAHMIDKGHCMFSFQNDDEILEYYDDDSDWDSCSDEEIESSEGAEMTLKSGIRIGNRQFKTYWKQNIRPGIIGTRQVVKSGSQQQLALKQIKMENKLLQKQANIGLRKQNDYYARVGIKHNMLQHHYREQNPM